MKNELSDAYLASMEIGHHFDFWFSEELLLKGKEWKGTEECATFARLVLEMASVINMSLEGATNICYHLVTTFGFNEIVDKGYDDYARGFIAGEILGFPSIRTTEIAKKAEEIWAKDNSKYGYYQDLINELKEDM